MDMEKHSIIFRNRLKSALAALFAAAALFMTGCPLLESNSSGSLTFRVTGEMAAKIAGEASARSAARSLSAEDVSTGSTTEDLYFDIALKGGYTASQTLPVTDGAAATFGDIPVGTTLYAEGEAYEIKDGKKIILYTGTSEKITIQEGVNTLSLKMQNVKQEDPAAETYTVTFETNGGSEIEAQTVTSGEKATEPTTAPTKSGYGFAGWYSDSNLTSEFSFDTAITADTKLYAKWTEDPLSVVTAEIHIEINYGDGTYVTQLNFTKDGDTFTYTTGEMFADGGATLVKEGDTLTLHVVPMNDDADDEYNLVVDTASNTYTVDNDSTYEEKITLKSWQINGTDVAGSWTKDTSNGF